MTAVDPSGRLWRRYYAEVYDVHYRLDSSAPRLKSAAYTQFYGESSKLLTENGEVYDPETKLITNHNIVELVDTSQGTYTLNDQQQLYRDDTLISENVKFIGSIGDQVIMIVNDQLILGNEPIKGDNPTGEVLSYRASILHTTDGYWYVDDTCIKIPTIENTIDVVAYATIAHGFRTITSIAILTSEARLFYTLTYVNFSEDTNLVIKMLHGIDPWTSLYSISGRLCICNTSGQLFSVNEGIASMNTYPTEIFNVVT